MDLIRIVLAIGFAALSGVSWAQTYPAPRFNNAILTAPTITNGTLNNARKIWNKTLTTQPLPTIQNSFPSNWQTYNLANVPLTFEQLMSGTALGTPTTGYSWAPETSLGIFSFSNSTTNGNFSTSSNSGRTGTSALRFYVTSAGSPGDTMAMDFETSCGGAKAGATSFLASPACAVISGDIGATNAGVYLQWFGDINVTDNGYDVAAIPYVQNMTRTNDTGALGASWMGMYLRSAGSKAIDSFIAVAGPSKVGIDMTPATLSNNAALALKADQRIYLAGSNPGSVATGATFSSTTVPGTTYLAYESGAGTVNIRNNDAVAIALSAPAGAVNYAQVTGTASGGAPNLQPVGPASAISLSLNDKGGSGVVIQSNGAVSGKFVGVVGAAGYVETTNAVTGSPAQINLFSSDAAQKLLISAPGGVGFQKPVLLAQVTVAALPTCNAAIKGGLIGVTDAVAPAYNAALTGGGTVGIPVYCNGTAWTAH